MTDFSASRLTNIKTRLTELGVNAVAIGPTDSLKYVYGFHPKPDERPTMLVVSGHGEALLMPELNAAEAKRYMNVKMYEYTDEDGPAEALTALLADLRVTPGTIAVDGEMRTDYALLLLAHLAGSTPVLADTVVGELRVIKGEDEIAELIRNARIADQGMEAAFAAMKPGMSEREVADIITSAFLRAGADRSAFTIVAAGEHGAFPHHHTGNTKLKSGESVLLDIGAVSGLYVSDITRMAFLGEPSEEYLKVHAIVDEAVAAALAAIKPGVRAKDVDQAARDVITKAGYGEFFTHRTGHGLGMAGHEEPYITATSETVLKPGMVFSVEPGIYLPGKFGVRLEEIVVVRDDGPQIFSELPREVRVI